MDYDSKVRHITVLPLKLGPYGVNGAKVRVTFWDSTPNKKDLTSTTNYYIISSQYIIKAYKNLVESKEIPMCDKAQASTFKIIPVWALVSIATYNNDDLVFLSQSLN